MPKTLSLFDLHCDTLYEATTRGCSLDKNDLQLSFDGLRSYSPSAQVLAVWSRADASEDENYRFFKEARKKLDRELSSVPDFRLCTSYRELERAECDGKHALFLAVEGGKLLSDNLSLLDELHAAGVRFLTLVWNKACKIGGAHDSHEGLTDFGRTVVNRCFELGIIPDLSHASDKMCDEVISLAEDAHRVCIATHSNSRAVCDHSRNLTDERFSRIARLGGIVGISLAPMHLTSEENCTLDHIVAHIEHYMSLGGEDAICLGCDLDGVSRLPEGIENVADLTKIAEKLAQINYTDAQVAKIFYANARNFISLWLN